MSIAVLRRPRTTLAALAAGGALVALTAAPSQAAFTIDRCAGSSVLGRGASFQTAAQNAFISGFRTTSSAQSCQGHPEILYNAGAAGSTTGSGAGRGAMGSGDSSAAPPAGLGLTAGQRDNVVRFGGTDEGPSLTQQQNMNAGVLGNAADDGKIHVVPIAVGAVAMIVNYPKWDADGVGGDEATCPIPSQYQATSGSAGFTRLRVPNWKFEQAWAGAYSTWGAFLNDSDGAGATYTGLANDAARPDPGTDAAGAARFDTGCANRKLIRVVRQDSSGTTYAFKEFLDEAAKITEPGGSTTDLDGSGSGTAWKSSFLQGSTQNRSWPSTTADNDTSDAGARPAGNTDYDTRYSGELNNSFGDVTGTKATDAFVCEASYVASAAKPVCRSFNTGAPGVRDVVNANNGSIGYVDVATAVGGASLFKKSDSVADTTYMMPLAHRDSVTQYAEPTADANGFKAGTPTGGANCANVPVRNLPIGTDPTTEFGWDATTMVYPTGGTPLYNDCSLTYVLAWDDQAPVYLSLNAANTYAQEQTRARAVKSLLEYIVSPAGQATTIVNDYSPLPAAVLNAATTGVNAIGWDKAGIGNQNTGGNTNTGGTNTNTGGTTQQPPAQQPPTGNPPANQGPPSNAFTITSARTQGRSSILTSLQLPGAGQLQVTAVGTYTAVKAKKKKKGKKKARAAATVTVGRATVSVTKAGALQVRLPLSSAAKRALAKSKKLTVKITVVFTPTGGTASTVTRTLSIKGAKK